MLVAFDLKGYIPEHCWNSSRFLVVFRASVTERPVETVPWKSPFVFRVLGWDAQVGTPGARTGMFHHSASRGQSHDWMCSVLASKSFRDHLVSPSMIVWFWHLLVPQLATLIFESCCQLLWCLHSCPCIIQSPVRNRVGELEVMSFFGTP